MARLPSVGGDNGQWGQLLNDFLSVEHNPDGTLKKAGDISSAQAAANAAQVDASNAQSTANSKYTLPGGGIPETDLDSSVQTKLNAGASGVPDATASIKGKLQLAGDLTGTASSPQITAGAVTDAKIAIGANIGQSKIQNLTTDLAAKYVKPGSGIPLGDVTSGIQASLGKADTSEQAANKGQAGGYAGLDGAGKVPISQLPNAIFRYQGVWNAGTNSPVLTDGSGDAGDVYRVGTAGSQNLGSGSISFEVGDYVVYNTSGVWEKSDTTDSVASVAGKVGVVTLTSTDVGLGNVPNTNATLRANHTGTQTASTISDFSTAADARITLQKGAIGGVATLDGTGKIPGTQLPALAITNTFTAANQAAQLALSAQEGDLAIRTDEGKTYVHNGGVAGTMADWSELLSVGDQASLAGKVAKAGDTMTGALTINAAASTTSGNGTSQLSLQPAASVSGASLLHFNIDRAWDFAQIATGAGTALALRALSSDKYFDIFASGTSTRALSIYASTTTANNAIGIYTQAAPGQGAMQFGSTATGGLTFYNTADQTTNYERLRMYWSGNTANIRMESNAAGVQRDLILGTANNQLTFSETAPAITLGRNTSTALATIASVTASNLTGSGGSQTWLRVGGAVNQSGTAGYTGITINPTETATGSGAKYLIDAQMNSVSRFSVGSLGDVSIAATATTGINLYNTTDQTTNYERVSGKWISNIFFLGHEWGGTAAGRKIGLSSAANAGAPANGRAFIVAPTVPFYNFNFGSTGLTGNMLDFTGSNMVQSSATNAVVAINPTINQSSAAGSIMLDVNPSVTATGSGVQLLARFAVGGSQRVTINHEGVIANTAAIARLSGSYGSLINNPTYAVASDDGSGLFMLAFQNQPTYNSTVTKTVGGSFLGGIFLNPIINNTGTTPVKGLDVMTTLSGGGTTNNARLIHVRSPSVSGSGTALTNSYGIWIDNQRPAGVSAGFGIFFGGTATAGSDINWNGDTNLYRGGTDQLKTDDVFFASSLMTSVKGIATTYTATPLDSTLLCNASGGAFTVTLPTAVGIAGNMFVIKKNDASGNVVTVATTSSQTIDGATTYSLAVQYKFVTLQSDGANWLIIGGN